MSHIDIATASETQENVFGSKHTDYMVFEDSFKIYCFFSQFFFKTGIKNDMHSDLHYNYTYYVSKKIRSRTINISLISMPAKCILISRYKDFN